MPWGGNQNDLGKMDLDKHVGRPDHLYKALSLSLSVLDQRKVFTYLGIQGQIFPTKGVTRHKVLLRRFAERFALARINQPKQNIFIAVKVS